MTKKCPNCCNVIRNVAVRCDVCGYVFIAPIPTEVRKCGRCRGTGWLDYPVCLMPCNNPQCNGGYIRV